MKTVIALVLSPLLAFAQTDSTLETIQVQGNKENKTFVESTESISVVPSRELDSPIQSTSIQALNALPNFTVNRNDDSFSIRGINNTGVTGYQKDNLSSIVVDDVFQTDLAIKAGSFDLWDINHAEVYRGPQSTTQGVNSLAGSVLLFHNKASSQTESGAKLGYGSFNKIEAGLMTNNVWLDGVLLSRITLNHEQDDGFIKNLATDNSKWGKKSKDHLGLDFVFNLNETDYIRWNTKLMQTDNGGAYVQSTNPFDYEVNEDVDYESISRNQQTSLRYFKKIDNSWSNEIIAAYSLARNDETSDADGTSANTAGTRYESHWDQYASIENLLKYQSANVKNVLGFHAHDYYLNDDAQLNLLFGPLPNPFPANTFTPIESRQNTEKHRTSFAIFDSYLWNFTENQALNLGLRYEYVKNKYGAIVAARRLQNLGSAGNTFIDNYVNARSGSYEDASDNSILLPKLAYTYTWNEHVYGVSYTEGFRTGGLSINRTRAKVDSYDPEKTGNFELSYKYEVGAWRVSSNAFYTDWREQQVLIKLSNDTFDTQVVNAASSELYGAEAEASVQLHPQHNLGLGAGYVKTRFKDFTSGTTDYAGNEFPFAPNWTGRLSYTYQISASWNAASILRYVGKSYGDAENTITSPEQFYLDLLGQYLWASTGMTVDLYARNILDSRYVIYDRSSSIGGQTVRYNQVNTPRELGFRVSYFW